MLYCENFGVDPTGIEVIEHKLCRPYVQWAI